MDFFAATNEAAVSAPPPDAVTPTRKSGSGSTSVRPPPTTSGVDAFAQAINARYSRAGGTSLIPLSPNQFGSTAAAHDAPPQLSQPIPPLSFTLTMPTKAAPSSAPVLSLQPPPPPFRLPASAATASPLSASTSMVSPASPASASPTSSAASFTSLTPAALAPYLTESTTLIIDIRPHNAYALARLPNAISLSVPSTLLKRPLFSLAKLAQMLSSSSARARFSTWPTASRIVVYDADSVNLVEGGNVLGLLRKLRKEGFEGELCWVKGGFKGVWRERVDLVDQSAPAEEEDDEVESETSASTDVAHGPTLTPGAPATKTTSAPATTSVFPGSGTLRTKHLPLSAFTSSSITSQRPSRLGMAINAVPPTPAPGREDPFMSLRPPGSAASTSAGPMSASRSTPGAQSFSLRLPPSTSMTRNASAMSTAIPEGKTMLAFPPRGNSGLAVPGASGLGGVESSSSLPTQGAGAAYGMLPRERPHYKSFPGVGGGQNVPFNPFFDNIRQNMELGGRGSGDGIPLKLSRRVRRRIGDLPFEWLREIARKSGKTSDDSPSGGSDGKEDNFAMKIDVDLNAPRTQDANTSTSEVSESEDEANGVSRLVRERNLRLVSKPTVPDPGTSSSTTPSSDGEELAKELAMQFYKIELGEQKRLMGVMEHHSMESGVVVVDGPSSHQGSHPMPPLGAPSFATNVHGVPSGGLCGPLGPCPASAPGTSAASAAPSLSSSQGSSTAGGQTYTGTAAARMVGAVGAGAESVTPTGPSARVEPSPGGVSLKRGAPDRSSRQREKAFPFSITAGVEKGEKNRYRNIWPFEHARVRLRKPPPGADDYMNASYVQPLGTTKRYIATQGPLPATFADFWTLCWQENVHVIVMLTREVESALVKCGNYWNEGQYGPLKLRLISTSDTPERERRRRDSEMSSGFFNIPQARALQKQSGADEGEEQTIRRVFELTHTGYPHAAPRVVTQLQYLDWPDLDVPKDPRGLLRLMREVEDVVEETREKGTRIWGEGPLRTHRGQISPTAATPTAERLSSESPQESSDDENDGLDPLTGIARHALANAPVLLHCSAGVGRTGGFIAIDAVLDGLRREMRKRREQQGRASKSTTGSPQPRSGSESPDSSDAMDVDNRLTSSPSPATGVDTQTTVPMSAGGNEVHVPVAGVAPQQVDMDVDPMEDSGRASMNLDPLRAGGHKASPSLVNEVRRAHLARVASSPGAIPAQPQPRLSGSAASSAQDSATSSGRRSSSLSGFSTDSRPGLGSNSSSFASSTSSLTKATKVVNLADDSRSVTSTSRSTVQSVAPSVTSDDRTPMQQGDIIEPSRLDVWRTEVRDTHRHHTTDTQPQIQCIKPESDAPSSRPLAFDYTGPRPLHDTTSPPLLSSYHEPIRRVIEDMREQRMSLCQSLRQYVFVHRAIIEGALMIVDEDKAGGSEESLRSAVKRARHRSDPKLEPRSVEGPHLETVREHELLEGKAHTRPLDAAFALREGSLRHGAGKPDVEMVEHALEPSPALPSPRSKRQASPTELVQEGLQGGVRLMKRPSIKRKQRSSDAEDDDLRVNSMVLTSPPPSSERR